MKKTLETKLKTLPTTPGVYFHKNKAGEIIYVGKAANLRNRVRQYFQKSRVRDPKTDALVAEIHDTDWTELETELDALFFEAEMVRRYMPQYNILLRDDKSFVYVRIDIKSNHPTVTTTRRPLDDGAEYLGPYMSKLAIAQALRLLRKAFPYSTHLPNAIPKRACLQAHLGLCPGLEENMTSLDDYRKNLQQLIQYLKGNRKKLANEIEKDMKQKSKDRDYEAAAHLRNQLQALRSIDRQVIFGDRENMDISKDRALVELTELLKLERIPRRIEGFDISHMQGTDTVASMVVFGAGVPDKSQYRKFKSRVVGNDDFAHMREVMSRRFSETNIKKWGRPDLILIDGGKGQVSAALSILNTLSIDIPLIGLAKRYEEIIIPHVIQNAKNSQIVRKALKNSEFKVVRLEHTSDALKLLMRIRDESHRFAVSYHTVLKRTRQTASQLESLPGFGPATRKKLLRTFGSMRGVMAASENEIAEVVGRQKAKSLLELKT
jgi:excinuclease ABC subunit C